MIIKEKYLKIIPILEIATLIICIYFHTYGHMTLMVIMNS